MTSPDRRIASESPSTPPGTAASAASAASFLAGLQAHIEKVFSRQTGLAVVSFLFDWPGLESEASAMPPPPRHPECADVLNLTPCIESWNQHLPHLRDTPEVYSHYCPFGKWCATVPAIWHGRCIAACKLACYGDLPPGEFDVHVDRLDHVVQGFVESQRGWLEDALGAPPSPAPAPAVAAPDTPTSLPGQGHVERAVDFIQSNLSDPSLSVAKVAHAVGVNVTHLAHLFARRRGVRMSRFISAQRVAAVRTQLLDPRVQIKFIVRQSGFGTAAWFRQFFRQETGMSPSEFRRRGGVSTPEGG